MASVAVITGGSSGLGLALAEALFAAGSHVVLLARTTDRLDAAARALEAGRGGGNTARIDTHSCDVADEAQLGEALQRVERDHGRIDFLVLSAGTTTVDLLRDHASVDEVTDTVRVNLLGAMSTVYLALPLLGRGARVLFISSGFGLVGSAGYAPYSASKGGMNLFADAMRRELIKDGIHVHLACPGDIDTPMYRHELEVMPEWIREKLGRGSALDARTAARRILRGCSRGKFLITISADVDLLLWVQKLLPRWLSTRLIDHVLPCPPAVRTDAPVLDDLVA